MWRWGRRHALVVLVPLGAILVIAILRLPAIAADVGRLGRFRSLRQRGGDVTLVAVSQYVQSNPSAGPCVFDDLTKFRRRAHIFPVDGDDHVSLFQTCRLRRTATCDAVHKHAVSFTEIQAVSQGRG
jgi:hypothetical protein